ncbi:MAG: hypothetical protein ABIY63_00910, partial [Fibrobacteria bacterium]
IRRGSAVQVCPGLPFTPLWLPVRKNRGHEGAYLAPKNRTSLFDTINTQVDTPFTFSRVFLAGTHVYLTET